jgi:hypothetical protein
MNIFEFRSVGANNNLGSRLQVELQFKESKLLYDYTLDTTIFKSIFRAEFQLPTRQARSNKMKLHCSIRESSLELLGQGEHYAAEWISSGWVNVLRPGDHVVARWTCCGKVNMLRQGEHVAAGWTCCGRVNTLRQQGEHLTAGWTCCGRVNILRQGEHLTAGWISCGRVNILRHGKHLASPMNWLHHVKSDEEGLF